MNLYKRLGFAIVFLLLGDSIFAQPSTFRDALLERLIGNWVLRGELAHKQTTHDVSAEWVLGHQYVRLHEISRESKTNGQPAYEAIVFVGWDQAAGEYACLWLDSTSTSAFQSEGVGHAKRSGDDIPFVFKDDKQQIGFRNTFSYDKKSDSWSWRLDNVHDGKDVPFGRVRLTRK
jgi:hypothetical protein